MCMRESAWRVQRWVSAGAAPLPGRVYLMNVADFANYIYRAIDKLCTFVCIPLEFIVSKLNVHKSFGFV